MRGRSSWQESRREVVQEPLARRARFAITLVGLDVLASRRESGDWPDACGGTDPFPDEPLRYERTRDGVRISAAAPELHDDLAWALRE
jgi:hypothetical protein